MFDVGFSELLIIAVVALLVLGPERLPKAARFAGLWVRRARAQWYSVKSELERELAQEDLKRQLSEPLDALKPQMQALQQQLRDEYDGLDPGLPERVSLDAAPGSASTSSPDATPNDLPIESTPATPAEPGTVEALAQAWDANRAGIEAGFAAQSGSGVPADADVTVPGAAPADEVALLPASAADVESVPVQGDLLDPAPRPRP